MATVHKKRIGDRREGRRLRTIDPYIAMLPFIMKTKSEASNYFTDTADITDVEKYLRKKRRSGFPGMGFLHIYIAVALRVISQYPAVNRFCSGQRIFARHDVVFIMIIKKELKTTAEETTVKLTLSPSDTIDDVYHKVNKEIEKMRSEGEVSSTDKITAALLKLPRVILRFTVGFLKFLDYFGLMPKSIVEASPFHGSFIITDLGSIGLPAIYHHLYNFGNLPLFIALGAKKRVREYNSDGTVTLKKYAEYKLVIDERICDGFCFSQAFRYFRSLLRNPEVLESPPEVINEDVQ